jgi:hypothetical protein
MSSQKAPEYKNLWLQARGYNLRDWTLREDDRLFDEHLDNIAKKKSKQKFQNIDGLFYDINNFAKSKTSILSLCYLKNYNPLMCV